jgi:hypothetical protein
VETKCLFSSKMKPAGTRVNRSTGTTGNGAFYICLYVQFFQSFLYHKPQDEFFEVIGDWR